MGTDMCWSVTGLCLGSTVFLVYINDLVENVNCDVKMFADDTSLCLVVEDERRSANELNADLDRVQSWAWQWKMQLNVNKTEEAVFSCKKRKPFHPHLLLGNDKVERKSEHKHLGMQLDSELNFLSHIKEAIGKASRGIGMIRFLSKYVARNVLDQIYKLYVRPHLDYGDIIYHKYDPEMRLTFTQRLEQTQFSAALAVAGAWRGTNRQRLYEELGWESLYHRRWYRRLRHFFNLVRSQSSCYLLMKSLPNVISTTVLATPVIMRYTLLEPIAFLILTFIALFECNLLGEVIENSISPSQFKNKLLKIIRPEGNSVYNISDIEGVRLLIKLRLKSIVLNEHKFRHNFDSLTPFCACGNDMEDNEHFLLRCPQFDVMRQDLFGRLSEIPGLSIDLDDKRMCDLLLFGDSKNSVIINRIILEATISFIKNTKRFSD